MHVPSAAVDERDVVEAVCEQLVGTHEIAERLGLKRIQRVHDWFRKEASGFPAPVRRIAGKGGILLWYWPDVEEWACRRPTYAARVEEWHYSVQARNGTAVLLPDLAKRFETSAELLADIEAGRVRTE